MKPIRQALVIVAALVAGVVAAPAAVAADYKIGVVNALKVLESAPQAEVAKAKLEKEFAGRDRELVSKQKELRSLEERMSRDGAIMSESERSALERDIINARRELKRSQDEFREDVNFRRNEEFAKIQKQIVEAIKAEAQAEKYDLILGEGVIYAGKKVDITEDIIQRLNK